MFAASSRQWLTSAGRDMATCIQGPPMSVAYTTPHFPKPQSSLPHRRRRSVGVSALASLSSIPPLNPKDPFLSNVSFAAANIPEMLLEYPESMDTDALPFTNFFDSGPQMRTAGPGPEPGPAPGTAESKREKKPRKKLKDFATFLLSQRIVYIGMPLVTEVAELVVMQLMFLNRRDRKKPIYLYIDSTGTSQDDGEVVASEYQGLAIYDALMQMNTEIHTFGLGYAYGYSCLLLAAGTKGKRYMLKHATAMIDEPAVVPVFSAQASDVLIRTKEAEHNRDMLAKLFAKHTGKPAEVVAQAMKRGLVMNVDQAIEYGVCDKIYNPGKDHGLLMDMPKKTNPKPNPKTSKPRRYPGKWDFKLPAAQGS